MKGEITVKEYREAIKNIKAVLNNYSSTINRVKMTNFRHLRAENGSQFKNSYIKHVYNLLICSSRKICKLLNILNKTVFLNRDKHFKKIESILN